MPIPSQQDERQQQQENAQRNMQTARNLGHMVRNFNDNPVGAIVGSQGGAPIIASPAEAGGGAAAAAEILPEIAEAAI